MVCSLCFDCGLGPGKLLEFFPFQLLFHEKTSDIFRQRREKLNNIVGLERGLCWKIDANWFFFSACRPVRCVFVDTCAVSAEKKGTKRIDSESDKHWEKMLMWMIIQDLRFAQATNFISALFTDGQSESICNEFYFCFVYRCTVQIYLQLLKRNFVKCVIFV